MVSVLLGGCRSPQYVSFLFFKKRAEVHKATMGRKPRPGCRGRGSSLAFGHSDVAGSLPRKQSQALTTFCRACAGGPRSSGTRPAGSTCGSPGSQCLQPPAAPSLSLKPGALEPKSGAPGPGFQEVRVPRSGPRLSRPSWRAPRARALPPTPEPAAAASSCPQACARDPRALSADWTRPSQSRASLVG